MRITSFQTKPALGSEANIVLVTDGQDPEQMLQQLWHEIFLFERRFSRFLPASELSNFNRRAGQRTAISPEFKQLLIAAQSMADLSNGLYNPFILPALQRAGYLGSAMPGYENDQVDDHSTKCVVEIDSLEIGDDWALIPYGTALDMGGCGKGYLADQLADQLDKHDLPGYWISLGGDMVTSGHDEYGEPWQTTVQSAFVPDEPAPLLIQHSGKRQAVATSGTFRRQNQKQSKQKWHHLINPRTGRPAETDILLATVVDDSCLRADVLATCAVVVGSKESLQYLRDRKVTGAYLQAKNGYTKSIGEVFKEAKQLTTNGAERA